MSVRRKRWPVVCGVVWSLLFACMSFYWAGGGSLGVETLGPEISRQAVLRDDSFILVVWLTGAAKVAGALVLIALEIRWTIRFLPTALRFAAMIGGIFLFLYGLLNFAAVLLALAGVLDLPVDRYSAWWRIFFWEPFWMAGGLFYFFSGRRASQNLIIPKQ
ncbi:DUF3995 domain-containing protein [Paenibacillus aurantius]|uniref:DUF3995 domain-containing protein n=1 Tax=Paenibacillus aurantius TaxID=2918900 RepID=A0AA96RIG7_9BACL|nr:DUF3995 domain-containing protein [Paenibacillus aurantius]WNQ12179.1 DUF3995 domain-containing protein [Paenibacillus aurantius]